MTRSPEWSLLSGFLTKIQILLGRKNNKSGKKKNIISENTLVGAIYIIDLN
jgi:hypothetical protein